MHPEYIEAFTRKVAIDPAKTALIPVDLQYASGSREHGLGALLASQGKLDEASYRFDRIEKLVLPNTKRLLDAWRGLGARVIYVTLGCELPDYADAAPSTRAFFTATKNTIGNREHEIVDEIKPLPGELVINKRTQGAFASSGIESALRGLGIETIVVTGVSTNNCVETTAREASDRGFGVVMVSDATGTCSDEMQNATLKGFSRLWGRVASTDEVIAELRAGRALGVAAE
ncbi:MAG TPA: isochorismatase family cysteine hydrolase [Bosea sp. (in: a-proteobacteria)]|jgi:nicotinamidase-related amidase|uniref:cysteine hydrolase family protein n=1 Tax=Bosea sp. (in: a-proteobacteria) TaxID=1871050 RepID=UPI002E164F54|nr:isochorismatase family cysteine hydrolase [Bosea sp. (in: a-proteobacteria)]